MSGKRILIFGFLTIFASSCIFTLNPIYTDEEIVTDDNLVGTWSGDDGEDIWIFRPGLGDSYNLIIVDGTNLASYNAHLVRLDGHLFLDLAPAPESAAEIEKYGGFLVPVHAFALVELTPESLEFSFPDTGWFEASVASGEIDLPHVAMKDGTIVTATTEELQAALVQLADEPGAFEEGERLVRLR